MLTDQGKQQLGNFNDTFQSFKSNSNYNITITKVTDEKKSCNTSKKMSPLKAMTTNDGFYGGKGALQKALDSIPGDGFVVSSEQNYAPSKTTKIYKKYNHIDEFMEYQRGVDKKDRRFHEVLSGEIVEAYDIDGSYDLPQFQDADGNPLSDQDIIDNFLDAREGFGNSNKYNNCDVDFERDVYIKRTNDPSNNKASFHIIIRNGYKFKSHMEVKKFMIHFNTYITENNLNVVIDNSLYSKNKTLRMLHSHKAGQPDRIAERHEDFNKGTTNGEAKLFCVSYLQGNEEYTTLTDTHDEEKPREEVPLQVVSIPTQDGEVNRLVDLICEMVNEGTHSLCKDNFKNKLCYVNWWKLKMTMINCSDEYNARSLFKKLYFYYRHNQEIDLETKFESSLQDKGKYDTLTIKSLRYYAKENPKYKELFPEHIKCNAVNSSLYMYNRMVNKRKKRVLKIEQDYKDIYSIINLTNETLLLEDYQAILKRIISNLCNKNQSILHTHNTEYDKVSQRDISKWEPTDYNKLIKGGGYLNRVVKVINPHYIKEFDVYNKLITADPSLVDELTVPVMTNNGYLGDEGVIKGGIFKDMFMTGALNTYDKIVFEPYLHPGDVHVRPQDFNVFQPFPFYDSLADKEVSPKDYESSPINKHIRDVLCGGDERVFNYTEKYLARMIQKPYNRPDAAIIFTGEQGVGKDMFAHCISNLIGKEKTLVLGSTEQLLGHFNINQQGKSFVFINEISDKGAHINKHEQLKHQITQEHIHITPKGIDTYEMKHTASYFGFSNKENIIKVEASERRFLMIRTNNSVANNHAYFKPLWELIENIDFLKSMFKYYATLDISDFVVRDLPNTQYKDEQKILNLSNPLSFILDMCKDELDHNAKWDEEENVKVHTQDLYKMFELWCSSGGNTKNTRKNFISELKSLGLVEHDTKFYIKGIMGRNIYRTGYHFNQTNIENSFKHFMKNQKQK